MKTLAPSSPFFWPRGPALSDVQPVFPQPPFVLLGDTMPFFHDGVCHLFVCAPPVILHYASRDLLHWEERPLVVRQGPTSADDVHWCATGTVVRHAGRFWFFYTGNQNVCLATSDDLDHWTKHPGNPVVTGDDATYNHEYFRDPYVFFNEAEGAWWMLLGTQVMRKPATRAGCVGLAKSVDLLHWTLHPPLWSPGIGLSCDCPQLIEHAGRWYLFYLERNARYRVADSPAGPFRRPPVRNLGTSWAMTLSRPGFDGRRWIAWPFICRTQDGTDLGAWHYAGPLGIGREYTFTRAGLIHQRPIAEVRRALRRLPELAPAALAAAQPLVGRWDLSAPDFVRSLEASGGVLLLPAAPPDLYFEATVFCAVRDMDARVLLRVDEGLLKGYQIILHPRTQQVSIRQVSLPDVDRVMAYRSARLRVGKPNRLRVFLCGSMLEVFVNDEVSLTTPVYQHRFGALGLEFRDGPGAVGGLTLRELRNEGD